MKEKNGEKKDVVELITLVTELKSSTLTKTDNSNPYFPQGIVLA